MPTARSTGTSIVSGPTYSVRHARRSSTYGRETLATMVGGGAQGEGCLEGGARDPVPNDGLVNDGLVGGLSEACRLGIHLSSNGTGFPVSGARSRSSEVGSRVW